jgi:hypothetical protein
MAVKIFFFFYILNITKIWLNMVVNDSLVSKVKKHYKGRFSLKNTFGVNDFLQKIFKPKIGNFFYKCAYLE